MGQNKIVVFESKKIRRDSTVDNLSTVEISKEFGA